MASGYNPGVITYSSCDDVCHGSKTCYVNGIFTPAESTISAASSAAGSTANLAATTAAHCENICKMEGEKAAAMFWHFR